MRILGRSIAGRRHLVRQRLVPLSLLSKLGDDEKWSSALGFLGRVFDQDVFNMPKVQWGLESTYKKGFTLSGYQESKVRWLHHKLTEWVGE